MAEIETNIHPNAKPPEQPTTDECNIAMLVHLLSLFGFFIAPLIIYLVKKDESRFVADHAKAALNFQLTLFIYYVIAGILCIVLIGFVLLPILYLLQIVCCILAAIAANKGDLYRYPITISFIK